MVEGNGIVERPARVCVPPAIRLAGHPRWPTWSAASSPLSASLIDRFSLRPFALFASLRWLLRASP
jgi:hypothetical protein